jgi:hypothetical protein
MTRFRKQVRENGPLWISTIMFISLVIYFTINYFHKITQLVPVAINIDSLAFPIVAVCGNISEVKSTTNINRAWATIYWNSLGFPTLNDSDAIETDPCVVFNYDSQLLVQEMDSLQNDVIIEVDVFDNFYVNLIVFQPATVPMNFTVETNIMTLPMQPSHIAFNVLSPNIPTYMFISQKSVNYLNGTTLTDYSLTQNLVINGQSTPMTYMANLEFDTHIIESFTEVYVETFSTYVSKILAAFGAASAFLKVFVYMMTLILYERHADSSEGVVNSSKSSLSKSIDTPLTEHLIQSDEIAV